jgi:carbon monoxide dehydrogenase subunit G
MLLRLHAVTRIEREPDWVFGELHEPEILLSCVPGGSLTRLVDPRTFEARIALAVGPFKFAYAGRGRIVASDPRSRTASLTLNANPVANVPTVRIRMEMAIDPCPRGSEVRMSFLVAVFDRRGLLTRGWVDPIACDLLDRTIRRLKQRLEETSLDGLPPAA